MEWQTDVESGRRVLCVNVPNGPDKPYARVHNQRNTYFIRVGTTCRVASREELERMFQASGHLRYGLKPIPGASIDDLDFRRLGDYFSRFLGMDPSDYEGFGAIGKTAVQLGTGDGIGWANRGNDRRDDNFRPQSCPLPASVGNTSHLLPRDQSRTILHGLTWTSRGPSSHSAVAMTRSLSRVS